MAAARTRADGPGGVDGIVELLSRWLAARSSRRSFLARIAKVAVLVATGPTLVTLLSRRAEARVCGQSGVTPKCPTFDCVGPGDVWGWCWYASPGCCANGGLKKICDCCTYNYPNVHGYCPSGTNVRCIVESCWADPRVMPVALTAAPADDAVALSTELAPVPPGGAVWLAADDLGAAVVGPLAAAYGEPLWVTGANRLDPRLIRALQRSEVATVRSVGGTPPGAVTEAGRYVALDAPVAAAADLAASSVAVAEAVLDRTGARRIVALDPADARLAPFAAATAAAFGFPVVIGRAAVDEIHARRRPVVTWLVGPVAASWAGDVAGGVPVATDLTLAAATRQLADRVVGTEAADGAGLTVTLVPAGADGLHAAVASAPGMALAHPDLVADDATQALLRTHQPKLGRARYVSTVGGLGSQGVWEVQSALNAFDTHQLVGVAGQGLPVISQPFPERELGQARVVPYRGAEAPVERPYWSSRANPDR